MKTPLVLLSIASLAMASDTTIAPSQRAPKTWNGPRPLEDADFPVHSPEKVELGRLLFFDKELSGNRNISCATCHHSLADTGDGLSLSVGEGGIGLGKTRSTNGAIFERVPRNAPPVFNLGAKEVTVMFHDGRVTADPTQPSGFTSPAGDDLPLGLDSALAAQAMFPVTSGTEMAGQLGENLIANAAHAGRLAGNDGVWELLAERLQAIPEYVDLFYVAFPDSIKNDKDITFVHAANAIAAFESEAWRASNTPFDRFLRGDRSAMSRAQKSGARLFYGRGGCGTCHSGSLLSDQEFHAIAMPQIGPGKGDGPFGYEDFGREQTTGDPADRYKFRTPQLRNVALTGPWGHAGAYDTLEAVVRHHVDPQTALQNYDRLQVILPPDASLDPHDFECLDDPAAVAAVMNANVLQPNPLSDADIQDIVEFLNALTDPASIDLRRDIPFRVPSGLPIAD